MVCMDGVILGLGRGKRKWLFGSTVVLGGGAPCAGPPW